MRSKCIKMIQAIHVVPCSQFSKLMLEGLGNDDQLEDLSTYCYLILCCENQ